jgi:hypothetical protein
MLVHGVRLVAGQEDDEMTWVSAVRGVGVLAGLTLIGLGSAMLISGLSDSTMRHFGVWVLMCASLIVPGALLSAPWSRIRPTSLWHVLFIALAVTELAAAALIFVLNTWSAMHGTGTAGFLLVIVLLAVWVIQLPAIWSLRPRRGRGNSHDVTARRY